MHSLRLIRLLNTHSQYLAETLLERILKSRECSDMRKVPLDHLELRAREIYRNLSDWLSNGTQWEMAHRYVSLGEERASQGVALSHFVWAIGLTKKTLYEFLEREGLSDNPIELYGSLELLLLLDRFFDTAIYNATVGYERYHDHGLGYLEEAEERTPAMAG